MYRMLCFKLLVNWEIIFCLVRWLMRSGQRVPMEQRRRLLLLDCINQLAYLLIPIEKLVWQEEWVSWGSLTALVILLHPDCHCDRWKVFSSLVLQFLCAVKSEGLIVGVWLQNLARGCTTGIADDESNSTTFGRGSELERSLHFLLPREVLHEVGARGPDRGVRETTCPGLQSSFKTTRPGFHSLLSPSPDSVPETILTRGNSNLKLSNNTGGPSAGLQLPQVTGFYVVILQFTLHFSHFLRIWISSQGSQCLVVGMIAECGSRICNCHCR